ncbi:MAG: hypothetical protein HY537_03595 [Deltaproteobacteria bacterium]|nr:hypothetical protein [Deltaproteobacteria bacterium]
MKKKPPILVTSVSKQSTTRATAKRKVRPEPQGKNAYEFISQDKNCASKLTAILPRRLSSLTLWKQWEKRGRSYIKKIEKWGFRTITKSRLFRFQQTMLREARLGYVADRIDRFLKSGF